MTKSKELLRLLEDAGSSDSDKLAEELQSVITGIFPNSRAAVKFSTNLAPSIRISFTLGKDKDEYVNGIYNNDPAHTSLWVEGMEKDGSISKSLVLSMSQGSIFVKSTSPYMAYDRIKVPFRKTTGDKAAITKAVKTYFERLKKLLQDNKDKLTDEHLKLIGNKF